MVSKFRKFIEKQRLFEEDDKILLACSGGIDSMVLADILLVNKNKFGIAHINHQTRGQDSYQDQLFVEAFCTHHKIKCHSISKPILDMAKEAKENFHAFARNFRYNYFYNILNENDYDYVATAHHNSDLLETFFLNLTRGTGLDGLTGIPLTNRKIIRPLLFASKNEIIAYAKKFKIAYREDESNASIKYRRNHIRHELIPKLEEINPNALINAKSSISKLNDTKNLLAELLSTQNFIKKIDDKILIDKIEVGAFKHKDTLLFHLLKDYGFNFSQCEQISLSINNTGASFISNQYDLLVDRQFIIIEERINHNEVLITIDEVGSYDLTNGSTIKIERTNELKPTKESEHFDSQKLQFPLTIRNWSDGDKFTPLGMAGQKKKVKDYLIDNKINRLDKKKTLVLISNQEIAWLIGHRVSENFKYSENTSSYFQITCKD